MKMFVIATTAVVVLALGLWHHDRLAAQQPAKSAKPPAADELDRLLAPIALYPDQLLAQILLCAADPARVSELSKWLADNKTLKGTELQDAATVDGFEPSFVALALFPQVVNQMAGQIDWTTSLGKAFAANKTAVFDSIQRLRAQAQKAGALKDTPQQDVETKTTSSGQQVIVIEPANPQVIYVPQYNPTVVYMPPATSTVVVQESSSADAAVAGLIGFTAGIVLGAAIDNDYYYGPYGWHGGVYMYNDAWDDWYDAREDAREDWIDHREDLIEERGERSSEAREQRTERTEGRQDTRTDTQAQRTERQQTRQESRPESQTQAAAPQASRAAASGQSSSGTRSAERSGTSSDAFSGYSSGRSERAASTRGQSSRSSSRGGGGGRRR
jgi:hypothetical protein